MPTDGEHWAIDARGLTKTFGAVAAVRGVTLQVPSGTIGSAPGVAVIILLRPGSPVAALAIAAIVFATMAAYYGSLRYAGRTFERRIEIISRRLA